MKKAPTYKELKQENAILKERIAYLERMLFGAKSDKIVMPPSDDSSGLFDDWFKDAMDEKAEKIRKTKEAIEREAQKYRSQSNKKANRPSKYQYYGLEEHVKVVMPEGVDVTKCDIIGKDVKRVLHYEAAKLWVEVIERPKLRLKEEKNALNPKIFQAGSSPVISGGHVAADMLAQIVINKYRYHLPEYRQIKQFAEMGAKLPASTVNDWVHAAAAKLSPLYEVLRKDIRSSRYIQVDEVPWRIADQKGKSRNGYAWQFFDGMPDSHGLYFLYLGGSRGGHIPRAGLSDYSGAVQVDGYAAYDYFEEQKDVTLLGCMAHVRRKFTDAQKNHPQMAAKAVGWIGLLYTLEKNLQARNATYEEIASERQAKAIPIMDAMEVWMEKVSTECTPSDSMGKALDYAYKLWPRLRRYTQDGMYHIDNNPVERNQRPTVIGRKNYLFSKSDVGAIDNAIFYSLIESCDIVGIDPLAWLKDVLDNLRDDTGQEEMKQMLPFYYKKTRK